MSEHETTVRASPYDNEQEPKLKQQATGHPQQGRKEKRNIVASERDTILYDNSTPGSACYQSLEKSRKGKRTCIGFD